MGQGAPLIPSLSEDEDSNAAMQRKVSLGLLGLAGIDAFNLLVNAKCFQESMLLNCSCLRGSSRPVLPKRQHIPPLGDIWELWQTSVA